MQHRSTKYIDLLNACELCMYDKIICDVTHDPYPPLYPPCHKLSHILRPLPLLERDTDILYGQLFGSRSNLTLSTSVSVCVPLFVFLCPHSTCQSLCRILCC